MVPPRLGELGLNGLLLGLELVLRLDGLAKRPLEVGHVVRDRLVRCGRDRRVFQRERQIIDLFQIAVIAIAVALQIESDLMDMGGEGARCIEILGDLHTLSFFGIEEL